ncbi:MAG: hypothetical protein ACTMIR_02385 [Cellulomonadaceae bacterium]
MVAQFIRLKATLLVNGFRRSVWQTIGFAVAVLYALAVVGMVWIAAVAGGAAAPAVTGSVVVIAGALLVLGWWIIPIFVFGVDATLDPQRFALFGLPRRTMLAGLTAAGLTSVPGLATALCALAAAAALWRSPLAAVAAVPGAAIAVLICVVGSRATTTLLAPLLESRRYREVLTVAAMVPLVMLGPAFGWFSQRLAADASGGTNVPALLDELAGIVGWTPWGAPWSFAVSLRDGAWTAAAGQLAVALATLVLVLAVWDRALARAMVTPPRQASRARARGLGWFARFPATPTGAVAARCLTYWFRDPRYSASVAIVPLLPVIVYIAGGGPGPLLLLIAPVTAWALGLSINADISYDNTAFALHVSAGVSGRADRWGRVWAVSVLAVPACLVFSVAATGVAGRWGDLPVVLGLAFGVLGTMLGVSSVVSSSWLYPVPKPGESPFKQPQGSGMASAAIQGVAMLVSLGLWLPFAVPGVVALLTHSAAWAGVTLVAGLATGICVLLLGVRIGARTYERRLPELLQRVAGYA